MPNDFTWLASFDSRFRSLGELATSNAKTLSIVGSRTKVLPKSIPDICVSILRNLWTRQNEDGLKLKDVAVLILGVSRLLQRKNVFLQIDMWAAYNISKSLPVTLKVEDAKACDGHVAKKRSASSDNELEELENFKLLRLEELVYPPLKPVRTVPFDQITLREDIFDQLGPSSSVEDDLPPCTDEEMELSSDDWNKSSRTLEEHIGLAEEDSPRNIEEFERFENEDDCMDFSLSDYPNHEPWTLGNIVHKTPTPKVKRRRLMPAIIIDETTQISHDEMFAMIADYSSLCHSKEDLLGNRGKLENAERPSAAEELMTPWPMYRGKAFAVELRCLYRSCKPVPLTFEEGLRQRLSWPSQGVNNMYQRSQSSRSSIHATAISREHTSDRSNSPDFDINLLNRCDSDDQSSVVETDESLYSDVVVENKRDNNSMLSNTFENEERPASTMLFDDYGEETFDSTRETSGVVSNNSREESKDIIMRSIRASESGSISFGRQFPPSQNSRVQAARAFNGLLELMKDGRVRLDQKEWCGEIIVRAAEENVQLDDQE